MYFDQVWLEFMRMVFDTMKIRLRMSRPAAIFHKDLLFDNISEAEDNT